MTLSSVPRLMKPSTLGMPQFSSSHEYSSPKLQGKQPSVEFPVTVELPKNLEAYYATPLLFSRESSSHGSGTGCSDSAKLLSVTKYQEGLFVSNSNPDYHWTLPSMQTNVRDYQPNPAAQSQDPLASTSLSPSFAANLATKVMELTMDQPMRGDGDLCRRPDTLRSFISGYDSMLRYQSPSETTSSGNSLKTSSSAPDVTANASQKRIYSTDACSQIDQSFKRAKTDGELQLLAEFNLPRPFGYEKHTLVPSKVLAGCTLQFPSNGNDGDQAVTGLSCKIEEPAEDAALGDAASVETNGISTPNKFVTLPPWEDETTDSGSTERMFSEGVTLSLPTTASDGQSGLSVDDVDEPGFSSNWINFRSATDQNRCQSMIEVANATTPLFGQDPQLQWLPHNEAAVDRQNFSGHDMNNTSVKSVDATLDPFLQLQPFPSDSGSLLLRVHETSRRCAFSSEQSTETEGLPPLGSAANSPTDDFFQQRPNPLVSEHLRLTSCSTPENRLTDFLSGMNVEPPSDQPTTFCDMWDESRMASIEQRLVDRNISYPQSLSTYPSSSFASRPSSMTQTEPRENFAQQNPITLTTAQSNASYQEELFADNGGSLHNCDAAMLFNSDTRHNLDRAAVLGPQNVDSTYGKICRQIPTSDGHYTENQQHLTSHGRDAIDSGFAYPHGVLQTLPHASVTTLHRKPVKDMTSQHKPRQPRRKLIRPSQILCYQLRQIMPIIIQQFETSAASRKGLCRQLTGQLYPNSPKPSPNFLLNTLLPVFRAADFLGFNWGFHLTSSLSYLRLWVCSQRGGKELIQRFRIEYNAPTGKDSLRPPTCM